MKRHHQIFYNNHIKLKQINFYVLSECVQRKSITNRLKKFFCLITNHITVTNHIIKKDEKYGGEFTFSGLFQDKSLFLKNSRTFPGPSKIP